MALPTDDPIASYVELTPLKKGGASSRTHRLVEINSNRLEFKASTGYIIFIVAVLGFVFLLSSALFSSFFGLFGFFINSALLAFAWNKLKWLPV